MSIVFLFDRFNKAKLKCFQGPPGTCLSTQCVGITAVDHAILLLTFIQIQIQIPNHPNR